MRNIIQILILFISFSAVAQQELNAYKYVVVPSKYEFQKKANQYGVNMLLKYKFEQLGFETFLDTDELPKSLKTNTCAYIRPMLKHVSTLFSTKIIVEIHNCDNKPLFVTREGVSKSKNYKVSYNQALREALKSFGDYKLSYEPTMNVEEEIEVMTVEAPKKEAVTYFAQYFYNENNYDFVKSESVFLSEISDSKTNAVIGKISKSSKSGIYHVILNNTVGIGYYDETGNFIVELLEKSGSVLLHKFQLIN